MNSGRPSSVGEILDRAIATYVRRFVPLFVISALVAIPIAVFESFASPGFSHLIDTITALSRVPPGHPAEMQRIMHDFQRGTGAAGPVLLSYLAHLVLGPLAATASIVFAAATLDDRPATVGWAYRAALGRWIPQIVAGFAFLFIIAGAMIVLMICALIVGLMIGGIYAGAHVLGIAIGAIVGIAFLAAFLIVAALANVAWLMTTITIALDEPNAFRAIGRALRRTLDGTLIRRTAGVALAILAIQWLGSFAFLAFSAALTFVTHLDVLSAVGGSAGGVVVAGVSTLLVLIYMRDVQVRREGSDLLLLASADVQPQA